MGFQLPGLYPSDSPSPPRPKHEIPLIGYLIIYFLILLSPLVAIYTIMAFQALRRPFRSKTAIVLVIGDIGRSPRMMYHTSSLSANGYETFLIGYGGTTPISTIIENPNKNIHILPLTEPPKSLGRLPWIFRAPIRVFYQIYSILYLIFWKVDCNTEYMLVQNPPSIPTLIISQLVCLITGSKLVVDWHNTGYSILAMRLGMGSPLVKLARWIEKTFGQSAYAHLFVTEALKEYLSKEWKLEGQKVVLHDRPPSHFQSTSPTIQHELFTRLLPSLSPSLPPSWTTSSNSTPFTHLSSGQVKLRDDRPALVVSSTSWTADEDFSLLLTALDSYQSSLDSGVQLPRLIVIITGKGTLRAQFEEQVSNKNWKDIIVRCIFLPSQDYPLLLGSADLGISLHTSSSGMDLPMKVVDMFGCGIPVLAKKFGCIDELVKDGRNGRVFEEGDEMGIQLVDLLKEFPNSNKLNTLKKYFNKSENANASSEGKTIIGEKDEEEWSTWDENWNKVIFEGLLNKS